MNGEDHKAALNADDVLIYLSAPTNIFPELLNLLEKFGGYSGYKLNIQKRLLERKKRRKRNS